MYTKENNKPLEQSNQLLHKIKRKIILLLTAFMMGMSNAMYDEQDSVNGYNFKMEQEDRKE